MEKEKLNAKKLYKVIRCHGRSKKHHRPKLIHALINIKSRGGMLYGKYTQSRVELLHILRGTKSFEGDVLSYFLRLYPFESRNPSHYRKYSGSRYDPSKSHDEESTNLPF